MESYSLFCDYLLSFHRVHQCCRMHRDLILFYGQTVEPCADGYGTSYLFMSGAIWAGCWLDLCNVLLWIFMWMCAHALISLGRVPRRGAAGSYVNNSFEELPACLPKWLPHFTFRQQGRQAGSWFSASWPALVCFWLLPFYYVRWGVLSLSGLALHFLLDHDGEHLSWGWFLALPTCLLM